MPRIFGALACSCGLWLACADVHEKHTDAIADAAGAGSGAATTRATDAPQSTTSTAASAMPIDQPSWRCARVVLDSNNQPEDLAPCVYAVDPRVADPAYLAVIVGDRIFGLDQAPDGFSYETGRVTLFGGACDEARAGATVEVRTTCQPVASEARGEYVVPECYTRAFDPSQRPADSDARCRYRVLQTIEKAKYIRVSVGGRVIPLDGSSDGCALRSGIVTLLGDTCERARSGERVEIGSECDGLVGLD